MCDVSIPGPGHMVQGGQWAQDLQERSEGSAHKASHSGLHSKTKQDSHGYMLLPVKGAHLLHLSLNQKLARVQDALGILHMWSTGKALV